MGDARSLLPALRLLTAGAVRELITGLRATMPDLARARCVQNALEAGAAGDKRSHIEAAMGRVRALYGSCAIGRGSKSRCPGGCGC